MEYENGDSDKEATVFLPGGASDQIDGNMVNIELNTEVKVNEDDFIVDTLRRFLPGVEIVEENRTITIRES